MLDFIYNVPTKIIFGKDKINQLGKEIRKRSLHVLLVYGGGSIKKNGIYDNVIKELTSNEVMINELSGVKPNPNLKTVLDGIQICKEKSIDFILAVGGGSVIDTAKAIAAGFYYNGDVWDFFKRKVFPKKALPVGVVLTLAATGSEMNGNMVISNESTTEKLATGADVLRPKFTILDPTYTFTVSQKQTAAGVVDIMSHVFEQYFTPTDSAFLQDRLAEGILKTCIKYGPICLKDPQNYEARANIMWAGSLALNGLIASGKGFGDWATHMIEHEVSAVTDVTHGLGLAIITPYWMEYVLDENHTQRFALLAKNVWDLTGSDSLQLAKDTIVYTKDFFKKMEMPEKLKQIGIKESDLAHMAKKVVQFGDIGSFKALNEKDVYQILKAAF